MLGRATTPARGELRVAIRIIGVPCSSGELLCTDGKLIEKMVNAPGAEAASIGSIATILGCLQSGKQISDEFTLAIQLDFDL